ncbi:MAG: hypothetical protein QF638_08205 [Acidimicrobiales bacterium]|nr:hypothetical protein [Acidimicrobiales bacterium]MDP7092709.1 hypothetical protein [Candidatus Thalassarchaeaceae archaeon]
MSWLVTISTMAGLALVTYGLWLAWPPIALVAGGATLLRLSYSVDGGEE